MPQTIEETSTRAIITDQGQLLILYFEEKQFSFLPGGRVEAGETLQEGLQRELREELPGFKFTVESHVGQIDHLWPDGANQRLTHHQFFLTYAADLDATIVPVSQDPPLVFLWIALADLDRYNLQPRSARKRILELQRGATGFWLDQDNDILK